jgi:hypothetical protein
MSTSGALGVTASADPKRMVLRPADLSGEFEREPPTGRYFSNAELVRRERALFILHRKDYTKLGRINGYHVGYRRSGLNGGLVGVGTEASTYRTARGAHASFLISVANAENTGGAKLKRLALRAPLGVEARLYWQTSAPRGATVYREVWTSDSYFVLWRHGRVLAEIHGGGPMGHNPRTVIALARKQQARITRTVG